MKGLINNMLGKLSRRNSKGKKEKSWYKKNKKVNVKKIFLEDLNKNFEDILEAYLEFTESSDMGEILPKGSECILNDFYLIELKYKELRLELKRTAL